MASGYGYLPSWNAEAAFAAQNMYGGNPMGFPAMLGMNWGDPAQVSMNGLGGCFHPAAVASYQEEFGGGMTGDEYEDENDGANLAGGAKKSKRRSRSKGGRKGNLATGSNPGCARRYDGREARWEAVEPGDQEDRWLSSVQAAMAKGEEGTEDDKRIVNRFVEELTGENSKMIQYSFSSNKGSRLVQEVLRTRCDVQSQIAWEMSACVEQAWSHEHANFVISKIIEYCPRTGRECKSIAEGIRGKAAQCARQRFGCRIVIKLIEECKTGLLETDEIITELLSQVGDLIKHAFGHHVISTILEHGDAERKQEIVRQLMTDLSVHAKQRHASHVVEKVLEFADNMDKYRVQLELATQVLDFAKHQFAYYCILFIVGAEDLSDLIEEIEDDEEDGGAERKAIFEKSGVQKLPGCEDVTHDTPPRDFILRILTSKEAVKELEGPANQDCKTQEKAHKFGSRMVEELRKKGHLTHLGRFPRPDDKKEERGPKGRAEVEPGDV